MSTTAYRLTFGSADFVWTAFYVQKKATRIGWRKGKLKGVDQYTKSHDIACTKGFAVGRLLFSRWR
ncbi:hypothetical protein PflCFBP13517_20190 [Pseudomonas fluorescens]|nr:hypothetical protein BH711_14980 [Pseudomonas fluorescens]OJT22814.1 hypothetical protein BOP96_26690 [Pseudomonas sp. FSL W5-0203]POH42081.1 hypothetical protein C2U56_07595 [Pseudomonas fluorescens]PRW68497.1 hypothetical protein C7A09_12550 [Pseudomonas fluorescens]TKK39600.1 hypothetical protein PflCFBP13517_20190 [Pseudomonas fluorescens]